MGHPDYVYRPLKPATRRRMSDAARARYGIPKGWKRLYGVDMPEGLANQIATAVNRIRKAGVSLELMPAVVKSILALVQKWPL